MLDFINIRIIDVIDILVVAYIMYWVFKMIRGTMAMSIFIGIVVIYLIDIVVTILHMQLLGTILRQVLSLGLLALVVIFQQEIRRFLLMIGTQYLSKYRSYIERLFSSEEDSKTDVPINVIARTCDGFSKTKTGALIVIAQTSPIQAVIDSGVILDAEVSQDLLESIFFKNSALHDGAVVIRGNRIQAARCILPMSDNMELPKHFGTRHRSAFGLSERGDSIVIVVSEETGNMTLMYTGEYRLCQNRSEMIQELENLLSEKKSFTALQK